jgi:6-phosphogluconolactonase (cycloisomerase 2 family)
MKPGFGGDTFGHQERLTPVLTVSPFIHLTVSVMKKISAITTLWAVLLLLGATSCREYYRILEEAKDKDSKDKGSVSPGLVFTLSNEPSGNAVLMYARLGNGELKQLGDPGFTGGTGTGAGLGSQGALVLDETSKLVFAVNAGSNQVSVLRMNNSGLSLADVAASGGTMPVSVTFHKDLLYVLNAGGEGNISGFRISKSGKLYPLSGAIRPLSMPGPGPAQIEFSPDGRLLVVTEKMTNKITTYQVSQSGVAGQPMAQTSAGQTPFGFAFARPNQFIVSEAFGGMDGKSALSSYTIAPDGQISVVTPSLGTNQTAACWVVVTDNNRYVYTSNTASGSISGYRLANDGSLRLLDADGRTGVTGDGSMPIDMILSRNSQYLYVLNSGTGSITAFRVGNDGSLSLIGEVDGLPDGAAGLAGL